MSISNMKIQNIEKRMEGRGDGKVKEELMKLASETPEEEAQMMLDMEVLQMFKEWQKKNKGGFDDFLDDPEVKIQRINLEGGGSVDFSGYSIQDLKAMFRSEVGRNPKSPQELVIVVKRLLKGQDKDGADFNTGGLVSTYKQGLRKP